MQFSNVTFVLTCNMFQIALGWPMTSLTQLEMMWMLCLIQR